MSDQEQKTVISADEQFYDDEIAPALAAVSKLCIARGLSFLAAVEFVPGVLGSTVSLQSPPSLQMVMLNHCLNMGENIDGYVFGLLKFCKENEIDYSRSLVMQRLAAPTAPEPSRIIVLQ